MDLFNLDLKKLILLIPILALPFISLNNQQTPLSSEWYGQPLAFVASFFQTTYYGFSTEVRNTTSNYLNLMDIKKDNQRFKGENAKLRAELTSMTELKLENERLSQLFEFKRSHKMELLASKVIGHDLATDHATVLIDRGSLDKVRPGQAVMTIEGVVGYVFRVSTHSSRVMLITDRYSVVDSIVQRTRARGIVEGKASESCLLKYVNKSSDVMNGDMIVTSGLDNIFPKGLPVATVELVEKKPYTVNLDIVVKPIVNPNKLEELFVVLNANNQELAEPAATALPVATAKEPTPLPFITPGPTSNKVSTIKMSTAATTALPVIHASPMPTSLEVDTDTVLPLDDQ